MIPLSVRSISTTCLNMYSIKQELLLKSLLTVAGVITKYPFSQSQVLTVAFVRSNFPVMPLDGRILKIFVQNRKLFQQSNITEVGGNIFVFLYFTFSAPLSNH